MLLTVAHSWIPWRFWNTIRSRHSVRLRNLDVFALFAIAFIGTCALLGAALLGFVLEFFDLYVIGNWSCGRKIFPSWLYAIINSPEASMYAFTVFGSQVIIYTPIVLLNIDTLNIVSRVQTKSWRLSAHLYRMCTYSGIGNLSLLFGIAAIYKSGMILRDIVFPFSFPPPYWLVNGLAILCLSGHWLYSLISAGRAYLRVDGWGLTVLLSQAIVGALCYAIASSLNAPQLLELAFPWRALQ
jgi:hypothetical protein